MMDRSALIFLVSMISAKPWDRLGGPRRNSRNLDVLVGELVMSV